MSAFRGKYLDATRRAMKKETKLPDESFEFYVNKYSYDVRNLLDRNLRSDRLLHSTLCMVSPLVQTQVRSQEGIALWSGLWIINICIMLPHTM